MDPKDLPRGYYFGGLYDDSRLLYPYVKKNDRPNPYSDICFMQQTVNWREPVLTDCLDAQSMTEFLNMFKWTVLNEWKW